jgi:hypothetical protein
MKIKSLIALVLLIITAFALPSQAATWNTAPGHGDDGYGYFSASGVPLAVVASVKSNSTYVVVGGRAALGAPLVQSVWVKPDFVSGTLDFYTSTNTWTCASNQPAGTNIIWLVGTNSGLATNDVLVLEHGDGTTQLLLLSGNATDAGGLVYSNSYAVGVKVWNTPTNTITAGDKLHKMALRQSFEPLKLQNVTNDVAVPWGNWWQVATRAAPLQFYGNVGSPTAVVLTYSNAASIYVQGAFKRREQ